MRKLTLWEKCCGGLLKLFGWTVDSPAPEDKTAIILAVPHTSILDFPVCYLYYKSQGETPHALVKKEMFLPVLGSVLKWAGAVPLDRKNATATIKGMIDIMKKSDGKFHLAIAPEGTRKPVAKWKTGYHTMAKALDCNVYLGYIDWKHRHIGIASALTPSDNAREDTDLIQQRYSEMDIDGRHEGMFRTK